MSEFLSSKKPFEMDVFLCFFFSFRLRVNTKNRDFLDFKLIDSGTPFLPRDDFANMPNGTRKKEYENIENKGTPETSGRKNRRKQNSLRKIVYIQLSMAGIVRGILRETCFCSFVVSHDCLPR